MEKLNMTVGRFQPFTKGHENMVNEGDAPCIIYQLSSADAEIQTTRNGIKIGSKSYKKDVVKSVVDFLNGKNIELDEKGKELIKRPFNTHLIEQEKQNGTMHLNRKEKQIVQNSFYTDGTLKEIPSKEKKRMVVLKQIVRPLKVGKVYTKQEIDKYLKNIYLHYEDLRQTLIDAGLLLEGENQTYSKVKTK